MARIVSLRDFAAEMGVSLTAIQKGISTGRITDAGKNERGHSVGIDADSQAARWRGGAVKQTLPKNVAGGRPRTDKKPTATPATTGGSKTSVAKPAGAPKAAPVDDDVPEAKSGMALADIQKARELTKLRIDTLKLKESEGELVKVADVKADMARLAGMVKSALLNIPERISAEIAGMNDPHDIHTLITKELNQAMLELAKAANV